MLRIKPDGFSAAIISQRSEMLLSVAEWSEGKREREREKAGAREGWKAADHWVKVNWSLNGSLKHHHRFRLISFSTTPSPTSLVPPRVRKSYEQQPKLNNWNQSAYRWSTLEIPQFICDSGSRSSMFNCSVNYQTARGEKSIFLETLWLEKWLNCFIYLFFQVTTIFFKWRKLITL